MREWADRSFWLGRAPYEPGPRLEGAHTVDVVIVGGGYTGLWTALLLSEAEPSLRIAVVERDVVGFGGSGRNGGFCMTMVERGIHPLLKRVGPERARATHLAMRDSVEAIDAFAREHGVEHVERSGLLTVSNGAEQDRRIERDVEAARRLGLDSFEYLERNACLDLVRAENVRCGHFEDLALMIDPAALVRGMAAVARARGVLVFEDSEVALDHLVASRRVEARSPHGVLRAERALLATNAYAGAVPALRPFLFTVCAYITLTERLTDEQWRRVGWERRMGVEDKRVMPHFHRPTADGRILWGGRDAPFAPAGPDPARDRDPYVFGRLEETFRRTFPQLSDVRIEHAWGGPVCGTVRCMSHVGRLSGDRILYALGYAGHGVGQSHLAARIVRDLVLGRASDLFELPLYTHRLLPLPPGPLRRPFLDTAQRVLLHGDDHGGGGLLTRIALAFLE